MPYIKPERRVDIILNPGHINELIRVNQIKSVGELNYAITFLIKEYIELKGLSYASVNDAIGVLECAKMELYRVIATPYEEAKRMENGDVY